MSLQWTKLQGHDWKPETETPYHHWWYKKEFKERREKFDVVNLRFSQVERGDRARRLSVAMPIETRNPCWPSEPPPWKTDDVRDKLTALAERLPKGDDDRTVIVGIVDAGVPLGHRRLRLENGETRFLAAWQQSARWSSQAYLPFGEELFADDINTLLKAHSGNNLTGPLDQDAFNRKAQLTAPDRVFGHRSLDYRAAHGAHIADLCGGIDPATAEDRALARQIRFIGVNLPPRSVHGTAGNFLSILAKQAVERIIFLADALWEVKHPGREGGYPVVIEFAFGVLAGPKDGKTDWELSVQKMVSERNMRAPTRIVMPTGNNNLRRGNARKILTNRPQSHHRFDKDRRLYVDWRVLPSDNTSNFVEIWAKSQSGSAFPIPHELDAKAFKLYVTPPGSAKLLVPCLSPGGIANLGGFARVYCYQPDGQVRPHFVVCTMPTVLYDGPDPAAPAGLWKIEVEFRNSSLGCEPRQDVTITVQSDQSGLLHARTARQAYFDDVRYRERAHEYEVGKPLLVPGDGRLLDSYGPAPKDRGAKSPNLEPWNKFGPVQRKGTQNALATWDEVILIGAYRASDFRPADYSATSDGNFRRQGGRDAPTVLYPGDSGPAHFGILAAGSKDGSVVALRGTSMASALAARELALALAKWRQSLTGLPLRPPISGYGRRPAGEAFLRRLARDDASAYADRIRRYGILKQGAGPVLPKSIGRQKRFGDGPPET